MPPAAVAASAAAATGNEFVVAVKVLHAQRSAATSAAGHARIVEQVAARCSSSSSLMRPTTQFRRELSMLSKTRQTFNFPDSVRRYFVRFIGACTLPSTPLCLITEFCERGSLADLIAVRRERRRLRFDTRVAAALCIARTFRRFVSALCRARSASAALRCFCGVIR